MTSKYNSEETLHQQVADYLRLRYAGRLFHSDFGSGIKLTIGQASKQKRVQGGRRAWPDIFVAEPRAILGGHGNVMSLNGEPVEALFYGLFLELKREGTRISKKDGSLVSDEHIREQAAVLEELRNRGYKAEFAVGFEEAKKIIDNYLGGVKNETKI